MSDALDALLKKEQAQSSRPPVNTGKQPKYNDPYAYLKKVQPTKPASTPSPAPSASKYAYGASATTTTPAPTPSSTPASSTTAHSAAAESSAKSDYYALVLGKKAAKLGLQNASNPTTTAAKTATPVAPAVVHQGQILRQKKQEKVPASTPNSMPPTLQRKKTLGSVTHTGEPVGASSSVTELLQLQIQRLETELKRKTEQGEAEMGRLRVELEEANQRKPAVVNNSSSANLLEKVELEKLKVSMKTMRDHEERKNARIETLTQQLADERKVKEDAQSQVLSKAKALTFAEKKLERVDQMMGELREQGSKSVSSMQQTIVSKAEQVEQLTTLCASQKERIELLSQELESRSADLTSRYEQVSASSSELQTEVKRLNALLDTQRDNELHGRRLHDEQLAQKDAERLEDSKEYQSKITTLEKSVAAIASGRGRLEQLQELHDEMGRKEAEFSERIAMLEDEVAALSAENEALAEGNAAMASALEGAGSEVRQALGSALDKQGWEERVKSLESRSLELEQRSEALKKERTLLQEQLEASQAQGAQLGEQCKDLENKLQTTIRDAQLQKDSLAATEKNLDLLKAEGGSRDEQQSAAISELQQKLGEAMELQEGMKQHIDELEAQVVTLNNTLASSTESFQAEIDEGKEERSGYKERMNEAIQERWLAEENVKKIEKEMDKLINGGPGVSAASQQGEMAQIQKELHDQKRQIQDLEGEVKRAKMDAQSQRAEHGDAILLLKQREQENSTQNDVLKSLTNQIMELDSDLQVAEKFIVQLEEELATLKGE